MKEILTEQKSSLVSLFTREWIEIVPAGEYYLVWSGSPSLRGSGLKSLLSLLGGGLGTVSLFTREWIEICQRTNTTREIHRLPLYEGVD